MDFEWIAKIVVTLAGAVGALKVALDVMNSRVTFRREHYKFAKEFFDDLEKNKNMHPYVRGTGYMLIAGDGGMEPQEVETVLRAPHLLRKYMRARPFLERISRSRLEIKFKRIFANSIFRRLLRWGCLLAYIAAWFIAWSPIVSTTGKDLAAVALELLILMPLFGYICYLALMFYAGLRAAEKLVRNQDILRAAEASTPKIVHDCYERALAE